jgi:DNA invertase Pin-like site-specific DNA recombinase
VNPAHLETGTHQENMQDAADAGTRVGTKNPMAKLTPEKIAEVRRLRKDTDLTYAEIGHLLGVHRTTIRNAVVGVTWSK